MHAKAHAHGAAALAGEGRLLTVEEARGAVLAAVAGPTDVEVAYLSNALGRILAEPVVSTTALPPWDNSAMDGYAIRAGDTRDASEDAPVRLDVVGDVRAGSAPRAEVRRGTAVRIATGAPIPTGADAVVPVELTTPLDEAGTPGPRGRDATGPLPAACLVHAAVGVGGSIRRAGSDLAAGITILEPGRELSAQAVALAAGAGVPQLTVHRRPRVAVLATGDEVVPAGRDLGEAGIPDANGPGVAALVQDAGAEAQALGIAKDRLEDVESRLCAALAGGVDAIVVSGGVSVGPYDVVKLAFEKVGRIDSWRVAVQPGKPFAFGTAERPDRGTALLFGLPGNPVSSFVTFELFVRPAIRALAGRPSNRLLRPVDRAVLEEAVSKSPGRRGFVRVVAARDPDGSPTRDGAGRVRVHLAGGQAGQGSHMISALAAADALAVIPETHDRLEAGAGVELWWLDAG
ncbi:MAG TPA: gephyrin-like molybdotransferase Glp [Candidatus Limnocylindrales bacterium]|nr:gephyrin-like molybdotransferase Glp [Candidatus Limnocylindrales bacterium]